MARGSLLIQQKGNQWPSSCFSIATQRLSSLSSIPDSLSVNLQKNPTKLGVEEGCNCPELPPQSKGLRQETVTQKIINISHFLCQFSSKNIPVCLRLTSPPLQSQGAMQIQVPPFFSHPLCFPSTPLPQTPPPSYCSDYLFSVSCRLHDRASPSLLLFLLSPG